MSIVIGQDAYDFSLPGVDGKEYSLADFANAQAFVLVFWCNHCPYVRAYEERTIALAKEFAGQVAFAAINSNDAEKYPEDSFEAMKQRAAEMGYPFPYLRDETQSVARAYGAGRTPEFFLFDNERELRYHGRLDDNHEHPELAQHAFLRDAIISLLNGELPHIAQTPPVGCSIKWK